ncbi:MAG TPA: hypothetical protein ENH02_05275 [Bacteroidetes bacterium]|nr:hypothetical protein [Bacteroidota bacterium]
MKRQSQIIFVLFLAFIAVMASCRKFEDYPVIPEISYQGFWLENNVTTGITERGVLIFSYKDGDGNLGLAKGDTMPPFNFGSPYYYNLILDYYEMQHGKFVKVPLVFWNQETQQYDTLTFNSRFPILTPLTGNKAIKGVFQDTLFLYNPLSKFDTIKFGVYIYDRDLNKSNAIETPPIIINHDTIQP